MGCARTCAPPLCQASDCIAVRHATVRRRAAMAQGTHVLPCSKALRRNPSPQAWQKQSADSLFLDLLLIKVRHRKVYLLCPGTASRSTSTMKRNESGTPPPPSAARPQTRARVMQGEPQSTPYGSRKHLAAWPENILQAVRDWAAEMTLCDSSRQSAASSHLSGPGSPGTATWAMLVTCLDRIGLWAS